MSTEAEEDLENEHKILEHLNKQRDGTSVGSNERPGTASSGSITSKGSGSGPSNIKFAEIHHFIAKGTIERKYIKKSSLFNPLTR